MYRIDTPDAVNKLPSPNAPGPNPNSYFTNGDPIIGKPGTILQADWANAVQEELSNFVEGSGIDLDKKSHTQVHDLLQAKATQSAAEILPLGNIPARFVDITGNTAISSLGTPKHNKNTFRMVRFIHSLTLVHNEISLILPSRRNLITAPGDIAEFYHTGDGNWVCTKYERADGTSVVPRVGFSARNKVLQPIAYNTLTRVLFSEVVFNDGEFYNPTTSYFTPKIPGKYLVIAQVSMQSHPGPEFQFVTHIHNSSRINGLYAGYTKSTHESSVSAILDFNGITDYTEILVRHNAREGSRNIWSDPALTFFSAIKIN